MRLKACWTGKNKCCKDIPLRWDENRRTLEGSIEGVYDRNGKPRVSEMEARYNIMLECLKQSQVRVRNLEHKLKLPETGKEDIW